MKHMKLLRVAVVGFVVIAATLVGGGIALAGGGGSETRERAEFTIDGTFMGKDVTADFKLRLRIRDGDTEFRARATVDGEGLVEDNPFSLCIEDTFGLLFFIEDDDAEADGTLVIEEELGDEFPFTTLLVKTVSIRVGDEDDACGGAVVLAGLVTNLDIE